MKINTPKLIFAGFLIYSSFWLSGCSSTSSFVSDDVSITKETTFVFVRANDDPLQLTDILVQELRESGYSVDVRYSGASGSSSKSSEKSQPSMSTGSGFIVSPDGVVLTNAHVVEGATEFAVLFSDGREGSAKVIAVDRQNDIASLQILNAGNQLPALRLGSSRDIELGDSIHVIGYPLSNIIGVKPRVTQGIVSANTGLQDSPNHFQISAPIQPGNSGGPVLALDFSVVGIATYKLSDLAVAQQTGSLPQNVNFAVDIDYAKLLLDNVSNESTWQPNTLSEAATATVLVIAGANGISSLESAFAPTDSSDTTPDEILVNFGYQGYWDAIHYTLRHLSIDFVDPGSGEVLASASFQGDSFSGAKGIAKNVLREVMAKFDQ